VEKADVLNVVDTSAKLTASLLGDGIDPVAIKAVLEGIRDDANNIDTK